MSEITQEFLTTLPENIAQLQKLEGYFIADTIIEQHTAGMKKEFIEPLFNTLIAFANTELRKKYGSTINLLESEKYIVWHETNKPSTFLLSGNQSIDWLLYARILEPIPDSHHLTINNNFMNDVYHSAKYNIAVHRIETRIPKTTCGTPLQKADLKKICDTYITKQEFINMGLIGHSEEFYLR